jgi:hypothetical protein
LATRRKYRTGGAVPDADVNVVIAATPSENPASVAQDDVVSRQLEATRRAEELQRAHHAQPGVAAHVGSLPENAQRWLHEHPEFMSDPAKIREIQVVDGYLQRKMPQFSKEYFDALDREFGFADGGAQLSPHHDAPQSVPARRSMPVSAPVSREVPSGGPRQTNTMTLSPEERIVARNSFSDPHLTNEQKENLYAQNKRKMLLARANGTLNE